MLVACAKVISECAQVNKDPTLSLLPSLTDITHVSYKIAFATAKAAQLTGVAPATSDQEIHNTIHENTWKTSYVKYVFKENI
jgi:malic enzyme